MGLRALALSPLAAPSPPDFDTNNQIENQGGEQKRKTHTHIHTQRVGREKKKKRRSIYLCRESRIDRAALIRRETQPGSPPRTGSRQVSTENAPAFPFEICISHLEIVSK